MHLIIDDNSVQLWLSARETSEWANRPGARWPCSQLSGKRLRAAFDRNGLVDVAINGRDGDCDASEFNAITSDYLAHRLPKTHPAYFVTVGQFRRD